MDLMQNCGQEVCSPKSIGGNTGIVSIIKQRQSHLQSQLDEVNAALAALEANPEIAKTLELVTKAARY